ncbi:ribose transport system ATP-binding protein [Aequitasia blattaphilus]|uniref:Sugar ABC transporter ATP-binding protein n=1 Tax=Aequitasia blattaphilus TaxID=2949332 RepID=A0ABT1EA37_9FIRM|nr:sugar ABC transporter ATP-binding protein [Aequitasia blattaphilus]MCP1102706.1 sugar ABC transporter ATP-binding protein [Aequitasia blattaphilus]MCR8615346.1 sugar ABC transporter ATP-binding protein [Aequitasia blattaphilus]
MEKLLEMQGINKSFSGVEVLRNIDFFLETGEVRALLGANGAGKSTLMKILCGVYTKTSGKIIMEGKEVQIDRPQDGKNLGIGIVHQELSIIPTLSVIENFFLGREIKKGQLLDQKRMRKIFFESCEEFGFSIEPDIKAGSLSVAKQQMVEIMKILSQDARIIIMDEPTTSLTRDEKKNLFNIIIDLKKKGKTIVYISHILEEVFQLSDYATIMRNGEIVGTYKTESLNVASISEHMSGAKYVGKQRTHSYKQDDKTAIMKVESLKRNGIVNNVSFEVLPGEVVGFAGLVGAGRTEIVKAIYGGDRKDAGKIFVKGREVKIRSPKDAIANGIGLIPEDRKGEGLILKQEIYKNAALVQLKRFRKFKLLNEKNEKVYAQESVENLSIKVNSVKDAVVKLSGGNQQKVVIAKWLSQNFDVLIFDEPTKGIDIGAKEDIFRVIEEMAKEGKGIIFISSDLDEVIRVSDRICVIRDGKIIKEMENDNVEQKDIMNAILAYTDQEEKN